MAFSFSSFSMAVKSLLGAGSGDYLLQSELEISDHLKHRKKKTCVHVVGAAQVNDDGVARQKIIKKLREGHALSLLREKGNAYDRNAVAVFTILPGQGLGPQVGYINKDTAVDVAKRMDTGQIPYGVVTRLTGGTGDAPKVGVFCDIVFYDVAKN